MSEEQLIALQSFARWVIKYCDKHSHIDSFEFEDKALELGLIREVGKDDEESAPWHYEFTEVLQRLSDE